ncbi:GNAT family N-acetyltransferase [Microbacterium sp. 1P10UB]|uniref:GNAT family N-acetyltransferase n=1 Tax=unclassified Microbacterium TaxID=2609290 RepID=UPI00399F001B
MKVRRILATDAERVRALRLEALDDPAAGLAFHETRQIAEARPMPFWTDRAVTGSLGDDSGQFIAEDGPRWVGTATVLAARPGRRALLVGVFVSADHRGAGVLDALVDAAGEWARVRGADELGLEVHVDNHRAQAAYRRLGFTPTGVTVTGPNGQELAMARPLVG